MNVLELWRQTALKNKLAKSMAECDELRELLEERDKETQYIIEQKNRTIDALRCELDAKKKIMSDTFAVFDSFYTRMKSTNDHNDSA
jgi:hypothetical protein